MKIKTEYRPDDIVIDLQSGKKRKIVEIRIIIGKTVDDYSVLYCLKKGKHFLLRKNYEIRLAEDFEKDSPPF